MRPVTTYLNGLVVLVLGVGDGGHSPALEDVVSLRVGHADEGGWAVADGSDELP